MYSLLTSKETKTFSWAPGELWFPGIVAIVPDGKDDPFCMWIPGNRMTDSVRICSDLKAGRSTYLAVVLFFFFLILLEQRQLGKMLESGLVAGGQAAPAHCIQGSVTT